LKWLRFLLYPLGLIGGLVIVCAFLVALAVLLAFPNLPSLDVLTDYQPKIPLRVYTAEGALIGEFGEERRSVISIRDIPAQLKDAILAAEDERFYQHTGVDYLGVLRAAYANLTQGGRRQGAKGKGGEDAGKKRGAVSNDRHMGGLSAVKHSDD